VLKVHFGRESVNKERYMFDLIKLTEGSVLLLVPDQFTLQAEKEAFFYLGVKGLMGVEALSFSRLGARIIAETGGSRRAPIDERGRYMLIAKLAAENRDALKLYKNSSGTVSFAQMASDLIYEMKQYNTGPDELAELIASLDENSILSRKLADIRLIYGEYEEFAKDKYMDGEDYIELFTSKICESELVSQSVIWIYGFDYFTPKNMGLLKSLMKHSREMNVMLTWDDEPDSEIFGLTGEMADRLERLAAETGAGCRQIKAPDEYGKGKEEKSSGLIAVESGLFSTPAKPHGDAEGVTLVKSANIYSEIESAAAYVTGLVRDRGLKYRDIAIICNDMDERGGIAKRVFSEYGIELFIDRKRSLSQNAGVRLIISLLSVVINGYRSPDIFSMLKTGMTDIADWSVEELENYSIKYKIKGNMWKSRFQKGREEYGEDFLGLEAVREELAEFVGKFEKPFAKAKTAEQKAKTLYCYLSETARLPDKLEKMADLENERGLYEFADETAQTWKGVIDILDQIVEIMGDEELAPGDFADILRVGFESAEVGVLPPTADGLIFGTMQRMRLGRIKALLVLGANEGVLPAAMAKEGLLNDDEKNRLLARNVEICRREDLRLKEERLAIYKNLSKPERFLWMSYSVSDNDGGKLNPSPVFDKIREIFPSLIVQNDIVSGNDCADLIQSGKSALAHMADALRESVAYGGRLSPEWLHAADWYRENDARNYALLMDGLFFKNSGDKLSAGLIEKLYNKERKDMVVSPSRVERYGKCPFSFFVGYGLRPDELRVFEIAGREIGDIYHNCIMRFSKELTEPGVEITGQGSRWMSITREECSGLIDSLIDDEAGTYREGVFKLGKEEEYRTGRIKEVCGENAWTLVQHVRSGSIRSMDFEVKFGRSGARIPPIEMEISGGRKVLIEGKIDRVDTLPDGSIKIIDYKSGREKFSADEAKAGFRLQLMLYLAAAQMQKAMPAGVFYFTIEEKAGTGRMDGVAVDRASVIDSIAGDFQDYSNIIPVRKMKDGSVRGNSTGNLLSEEEFKELQDAVDNKVRALCDELISGYIDIRPKRSNGMTACTYCEYGGICGFDVSFDGFKYENI